MFKDFKDFAFKGNVIDMAVGIIIGAAFGTIARSLVDDIIMPPIGMLIGNIDFTNLFAVLKSGSKHAGPYATLADAKAAGAVTINYGIFLTNFITFIIVAFAVYLLVKMIKLMEKKEQNLPAAAPSTKDCPYCKEKINITATRCPHCTADLKTV